MDGAYFNYIAKARIARRLQCGSGWGMVQFGANRKGGTYATDPSHQLVGYLRGYAFWKIRMTRQGPKAALRPCILLRISKAARCDNLIVCRNILRKNQPSSISPRTSAEKVYFLQAR